MQSEKIEDLADIVLKSLKEEENWLDKELKNPTPNDPPPPKKDDFASAPGAKLNKKQQAAYDNAVNQWNKETGRTNPTMENGMIGTPEGIQKLKKQELSNRVVSGMKEIGKTVAKLYAPILLAPVAGLLAGYGIKLIGDKIKKFVDDMLETIFSTIEQNGGGALFSPNLRADQLLQMDCQAIIARAKQNPRDQYSSLVISVLTQCINTKLAAAPVKAQKEAVKESTDIEPLHRIIEFINPVSLVTDKIKSFAADPVGSMQKRNANKTQPINSDEFNYQMNQLKKSPQQITLSEDIENLKKKCEVIDSEYAKKILQAVMGLR